MGTAALAMALALVTAGCGGSSGPQPDSTVESGQHGLTVIAVESFIADIARNVAGDKAVVESLIPLGTDPHAFELTPRDATRVENADLLILNGAGLEPSLEQTVQNIVGDVPVIEASAGLAGRTPGEGEEAQRHDGEEGEHHDGATSEEHHHHEGDPHFWLDPLLVIAYVENIRDGLSRADPANATTYEANAAAYMDSLRALDTWIAEEVAAVPPENRRLVTNHESFGYFADRYGFQIVGTILRSASPGASPSAQSLARLVKVIEETGVPAIFLETGSDPRLAEQIVAETGVEVVFDLHSHSLTGPDGPAPTYIDMIKANTRAIVKALK